MKKAISVLLTLCMVVTLAVGCSGGKDSEKSEAQMAKPAEGEATGDDSAEVTQETSKTDAKDVTLTWTVTYKPELFEDFINAFEKANPGIKLECSFVPSENYAQILRTQLAAGEGPDICIGGLEEGKAGYLYDITNEAFMDNVTDTARYEATKGGQIWGLPVETWMEGIVYNKKMFEEHNVEIPVTWDEFLDVCDTFKAAGIKPFSCGNKEGNVGKQIIGVILTDAYAKNLEIERQVEEGQTTYAKEWKSGFEKWYQIIERGILDKDIVGMTYDEGVNEFLTGQSAMLDTGNWEVANMHEKNPELDFGIFPFPAAQADGNPWMVGGVATSLAINANSEHIEEALKVLEFAATPEGDALIIAGTQGGPTIKGVTKGVDPSLEGALEAVSDGRMYCPWSGFTKIGVDPMVTNFFKLNQEVIIGTKTIDQALADLDKAIQDALANADK